MRYFLTFWIVFCHLFCVHAQQLDSIRCSILTCSPGKLIYELYGHTAIRCENFTQGVDVVFNYGVFSFRQPHFVWRFVQGKCDYCVAPIEWNRFVWEYAERGSSITAQVLDLTPQEAQNLYRNLWENCQEGNSEYRYNFLYNNCTTKVRDQIEQVIQGNIMYPTLPEKKTYRQILHEYAPKETWESEATDFLLGMKVDTILTDRAAMFAPEYWQFFAQDAQVYREDGSLRPLLKETKVELQALKEPHIAQSEGISLQSLLQKFLSNPLWVMCGVLALFLIILWLERVFGHVFWLIDIPLLLLQGSVGCLLLFMWLCSEHPGVDMNWLVWPFSPLAIFVIPSVTKSAFKHEVHKWHAIQALYLTFFIIFCHWIPQDFGWAVLPLTLALLTRPVSYLLYYQNARKPQKGIKKKKR